MILFQYFWKVQLRYAGNRIFKGFSNEPMKELTQNMKIYEILTAIKMN